jgi:hypothetical protein
MYRYAGGVDVKGIEPVWIWGLYAVGLLPDIVGSYYVSKWNPERWRRLRPHLIVGTLLPAVFFPAVGACPLADILPPALAAAGIGVFFHYYFSRMNKPEENPYKRADA